MEPGYLNVNWNHIPGLFHRQTYMRTMVIPPADLDRICDPTKLTEYWEPTDEPEDFHTTLALAFVRDLYHDCVDKTRRNELVVSVAMVRKPAHNSTMTFTEAALELQHPAERTPTLLLVQLHRKSGLFPDCYYHHRRKHFALFYDTGEDYNCGSPLRFIGAELLSSYEPGKDYSPRAKLPPSWRKDLSVNHPVNCCVRDYSDWTTGFPGVPSPEVHFAWLSEAYIPFAAQPGQEIYTLPNNMMGLPPVTMWPPRGGPIPWVLDPAEHPRPDDPSMSQSLTDPGRSTKSGGKTRKRKKRHGNRKELRVTDRGSGKDEPRWVTCSSSSSSDGSDTTARDSGVNLASPVPSSKGSKKAKLTSVTVPAPGSNVSRTPPLSPDTLRELDAETTGGHDLQLDDDAPLSGQSDHPDSNTNDDSGGEEEMAGVEEYSDGEDGQDGADGDKKDTPGDTESPGPKAPATATETAMVSSSADPTTTTTPAATATAVDPPPPSGPGATPGNPDDSDTAVALAYAIQSRVLASPALAVAMAQMGQGSTPDGDEEDKTRQEEYEGVMKGLRAVTRIMSVGFVKASRAVQEVVNGTLEKVVLRDRHFIEGASSSLMRWIRAVHPAIDGLGRGAMAELRLRSDARRDGMRVAREILNPYGMGEPSAVQSDPLQDIIIRAFTAARQPTELAMIEVHKELAPVTSQFVPPGQERVFLAGVYNIICSYIQEVHSMVLGQAVVPTQVVPGIWGARRGILAEAPLLAPQIGPAEAPTPPNEVGDARATEKTETGTQSEPAPASATIQSSTSEVPAQWAPPLHVVAPLSSKKSPATASKPKGTPGSGARRAYTQQSVRSLWNDPERRREDEAFERVRAQGRSNDIPVIIMEDEKADALLAQQRASRQSSSSTRSATTVSKPKPTATSSRAPDSGATDSGATHSGSPVPQDRTRRPSPTMTRPVHLSVPMPASFQLSTHRKRDENRKRDETALPLRRV